MRRTRLLALALALATAPGCSLLFSSSHHVGGEVADSGTPDGASSDSATDAAVDAAIDAGCDSADPDGDGVSECEGDCAPDDPTIYPDAPPICGNGVYESCTHDARATLSALFHAEELGVFHREILLPASLGSIEDDFSFGINRGDGTSHAIEMVAAVHDGTVQGTHAWLSNPIVDEAPTPFHGLFGSNRTAPIAALSFHPANDPNGATVSAFAIDAGAMQTYSGDLFLSPQAYTPAALESTVSFGGTTAGVASTARELDSENIIHGVLVHRMDETLHFQRIDQQSGLTDDLGPLGAYRALILRANNDGIFVAQSLATPEDTTWIDTNAGNYSTLAGLPEAPFRGPVAPISRAGGAAAFVTTGNAIHAGTVTGCGTGACALHTSTEIAPAGDLVSDLRGVVVGTAAGIHGHAVALVRHGASEDTIELILLTDTAAPLSSGAGPALSVPIGGRVDGLGLGTAEQAFMFEGTSAESTAYAVAFGALVTSGGARRIIMSGVSACELH